MSSFLLSHIKIIINELTKRTSCDEKVYSQIIQKSSPNQTINIPNEIKYITVLTAVAWGGNGGNGITGSTLTSSGGSQYHEGVSSGGGGGSGGILKNLIIPLNSGTGRTLNTRLVNNNLAIYSSKGSFLNDFEYYIPSGSNGENGKRNNYIPMNDYTEAQKAASRALGGAGGNFSGLNNNSNWIFQYQNSNYREINGVAGGTSGFPGYRYKNSGDGFKQEQSGNGQIQTFQDITTVANETAGGGVAANNMFISYLQPTYNAAFSTGGGGAQGFRGLNTEARSNFSSTTAAGNNGSNCYPYSFGGGGGGGTSKPDISGVVYSAGTGGTGGYAFIEIFWGRKC